MKGSIKIDHVVIKIDDLEAIATSDERTVEQWSRNAICEHLGVPVNSVTRIGNGAFVIIDDPIRPERDKASPEMQQKVKSWYDLTIANRGVIICKK